MKYKARIEKLDWKGNIKVSFREFEDKFNPTMDKLFEDFVKTGKLRPSMLPKPDLQYWDIMRNVAPARSTTSFEEYEPGIRSVAGEYFASPGVQYVVSDRRNRNFMGWKEVDSDITEG